MESEWVLPIFAGISFPLEVSVPGHGRHEHSSLS